MSRELIIQKLLGFLLVAAAVAFMTPFQMGLLFSVLGQGHFLGAYYYQWKAGKIRAKWAFTYALLAAVLFSVAITTHKFEWFALFAGVLFFIHHFQDEVTLFGSQRLLPRAFEQLPPILLYSSFSADALFGTAFSLYAVIFSIALLVLYAGMWFYKRASSDHLSIYFWLITAGLIALWMSGVRTAPETLLGSVILFHYICWYVYFYYRFAKDKVRQYMYVREMLAIHAIVFGFYAVFVYTTWGSLWLGYVFLPIYFYIWAILHIVFSIRTADYRDIFKW